MRLSLFHEKLTGVQVPGPHRIGQSKRDKKKTICKKVKAFFKPIVGKFGSSYKVPIRKIT